MMKPRCFVRPCYAVLRTKGNTLCCLRSSSKTICIPQDTTVYLYPLILAKATTINLRIKGRTLEGARTAIKCQAVAPTRTWNIQSCNNSGSPLLFQSSYWNLGTHTTTSSFDHLKGLCLRWESERCGQRSLQGLSVCTVFWYVV